MRNLACLRRVAIWLGLTLLPPCGCAGSSSADPSAMEGEDDPAIPGALVSAARLKGFLGGKSGILIWVSNGKLRTLDFRTDGPAIKTLAEDLDSVNPLLSPDGTRVVYSQGSPNGPKFIFVRKLDGSPATKIATGDIGYWYVAGGEESIVYADWVDKSQNGEGGSTYKQKLVTSSVALSGAKEVLHDRAMDAGPNGTLRWLGQVYDRMFAYDLESKREYGPEAFFLKDGAPADHQTCNGSWSPDDSARMMVLAIPHDFIRIFTYQPAAGSFRETSRFVMPAGKLEWEFPEWSTSPGFFTTILRTTDLKSHLMIAKIKDGDSAPDMLEVIGAEEAATFSHLYVQE